MISISIDLVGPHRLLFGGSAVWTKYSLDYTDFSAAAATETITLASLAAKTVIHAAVIKHSTAFSGGALTAYTLEVGTALTPAKFASAFDVFQAVGAAVGQVSTGGWCEDYAAPYDVKITANVVGDLLNAATAGAVDVWLYTSTLS